MNKKAPVRVLLDCTVVLLMILALVDLANSRFGEFSEDCGFATLLLLLNLDWPPHPLRSNPEPVMRGPFVSDPERRPATSWN